MTLANLGDAIAARDNASNRTDEFTLLESFRLDAQHNETCFTNANGDKIDLDSHGFTLDVPLNVEEPHVLVMNEDNGNVTAEVEDATIGTVCQYPGLIGTTPQGTTPTSVPITVETTTPTPVSTEVLFSDELFLCNLCSYTTIFLSQLLCVQVLSSCNQYLPHPDQQYYLQ